MNDSILILVPNRPEWCLLPRYLTKGGNRGDSVAQTERNSGRRRCTS